MGEKESLITFRNESKSIRLMRTSGVVCITSGSGSREWASSCGGALSSFLSVGGGVSGHKPSARPSVVAGPWGCPTTSAAGSQIVALPNGGASAARGRNGRAPSRRSGCSGAGALLRSSVSGLPIVGARFERRAEVTGIGRGSRSRGHRAAWRVIRNAMASSQQSVGRGLIRTFG
jgi:hypothetical protein